MKVLIIGSGGREHALTWKILQSKKVLKIYCAPGNPGTALLAKNINISICDIKSLLKFVQEEKIDLTIVGPEAPLILGIVDLFEKNNLAIIGPSKRAAQIEGSKVFAKKIMLWNNIPTAKFVCFDDYKSASKYLKTQKYPLVIKAEGQCLGKGVSVCQDDKSAQKFVKDIFINKIFKDEGKRIVIEEYLTGQEISFMVATDGINFASLIPSQDHKGAYDGDKGPNTGGMGAYAPVPFVDSDMVRRIEDEIVKPTLRSLAKHGNLYKGILYPGLILTKDGPKVLEYNCRFGDPETQAVLSLLETDIIDVFEAINNQQVKRLKLRWFKSSAVNVVLAAKGYPKEYEKGKVIKGTDKYKGKKDVFIFHAGTKIQNKKLLSCGGRVIGVTARGKNLKEAIDKAYKNIGKKGIHFPGMHYRKDIGKKGLIPKL